MRTILVVAMLLITVMASAQITTSSMSGKVTTQNEAIIGATVVAIHEPSGTRYGALTNVSGQFNLQGMRTGGPYKVEISYIGYQTAIYKGVSLSLGENYVLNVSLKESAKLLDEIVVTASKNSNMKSDRAGAVVTVNREMISSIPTISRSISDIMRLSPQGADVGNGIAIGGGNYRQLFVTVDGAAFNNTFGLGGNLPANGSPISLDALEQVSISVTPYDVRQSGFIGGAINAVTRSGDNKYRGSAYMYFNNENLNGNKVEDFELLRSKAQLYTYGANIGGPIIKDKLFFFVNGEYEDNVSAGSNYQPRNNVGEGFGSNNVHRPLASDLNEISRFLRSTYGFDPGAYNNYSVKTPSYRIMTRLDWNANENNRVSLRFSRTHTKDSNFPANSTNPLYGSDLYPGGTSTEVNASGGYDKIPSGQGRTSKYAMSFSNSNYYQVRDFTSVASEWNMRIGGGAINNMLRFAYSFQHEPRSFDGSLFPTVDILKDGAVYANFGAELFTAGNMRQTSVYTITDEFNWNIGINKITTGFQYEYTKAANGYMLGGTGYYVYSSWDDFKQNKAPSAFAITHSNSADMSQFLAELNFQQYSLYFQDEIAVSENLKVTAGLRFELPTYPSMKDNYNADFAKLGFGDEHYSTDQLPSAKVSVSPRVGFNWDITGERKYVLRGGTGLFVGRLPFIWLVSAVSNSGVGQTTYYYTKREADTKVPSFHQNREDILNDLYKGQPASKIEVPSDPTILDKSLKMPSTWKTSLAIDMKLPGDIDFTLEGIYNRDYNPVVITNRGFGIQDAKITLSPNDVRDTYKAYHAGKNVYFIENWKTGAYYYSILAQLRKNFNFGLDVLLAYVHSKSRTYSDGIGDQVLSAYKTNTYSRNGINDHELGYGTYVTPNRLLATIGYRKEYGKHFATSVSLLYEGMQMGYASSWGYSRYSYTIDRNVVGDKGAYSLLYIPASREELDSWTFSDDQSYPAKEQKDDFWNYINQDKYLKKHKGEYAERGGAIMPWHHQVDFKLNQDFYMNVGSKRNLLQVGVDIKNFPNLLNSDWGVYKQVRNTDLLQYSGGKYTMSKDGSEKLTETYRTFQGFKSTYSVQFSLRYIFN